MKANEDAYGRQLLATLRGGSDPEIIERDDRFIGNGSGARSYFLPYREWSVVERNAIALARGRVLDIGCGAGRHALYLQGKGHEVTGIDNSPGAIAVCKERGLKRALVRSIDDLDRFAARRFDTVVMFGNNFSLVGSARRAPRILRELARITTDDARVLAATVDPYRTTDPAHLAYHARNRKRGRMAGQIRMRVRYGSAIGPWFDYLFLSPDELVAMLEDSPWRVARWFGKQRGGYVAVLEKV
jgi:SAM-dependent methyltransferase